MNTELEHNEQNEADRFVIPERMTTAIAGLENPELKQNFIDTAKKEGLESALAISRDYIRGIQAKIQESIERTVDPMEKQALGIQQHILPQIGLAVMLHEAGLEEEVDEVLEGAFTQLEQSLAEENLAHREYFEALLKLI
jgi:hypothetical protein